MGERWYVVQTKPAMDFFTEKQLRRQRYEVCFPTLWKERRRHGVPVKCEQVPLFPSYGFVRLDVAVDRWKPVCHTYGVRRLFLSAADMPLPLPIGFVEQLQGQSNEAAIVQEYAPMPDDCMVQVDRGPFAGCSGIYKFSTQDRITLLMQILGNDVVVAFKRNDVHQIVQPAG